MEEHRDPDTKNFKTEQKVLWHSLKKVDDIVKILWPGQSKCIQRKVLNHVISDGHYSSERVKLMQNIILFGYRGSHI